MENQEQEIDLKEILFLLLGSIKFIIVLTILFGAAFFCYAKFWLPVEYTSSVSIYVKNTAEQREGQTATQSDLTAAKSLASTYIVILDDDVVYEKVSDKLLETYHSDQMSRFFSIRKNESGKEYIPASQIRSKVKAAAINNTEVIKLTAVTKDPQLSADICNIISDYAKELLIQVTKAGSVESIGTAKVPTGASGPNVKKYGIIGALLGAVIAVAIVIIRKLLDNCINSAEDIKQKFGIPVLGEIPDLDIDEKEGNRYEY